MSDVRWDDVSVRLRRESDVPFIVDYWFGDNCPLASTINWSAMGSADEMRARLLAGIANGLPPLALTVEFRGNAIGMHALTELTTESADIHAHFWDPSARGRGIGHISAVKAAREFLRIHGLRRLYAKPPKSAPMSNRAAQKLPLRKIGEEILTYKTIVPGQLADVYLIEPEDLDRLEAFLKAR